MANQLGTVTDIKVILGGIQTPVTSTIPSSSETQPARRLLVNQGSLSAYGMAILNHNLGVFPSAISIIDPSGERILVEIKDASADIVVIDFSDFIPLSGDYTVLIRE